MPSSWMRKLTIVKFLTSPILIGRFNATPNKNPSSFYVKKCQVHSKMYGEMQRTEAKIC